MVTARAAVWCGLDSGPRVAGGSRWVVCVTVGCLNDFFGARQPGRRMVSRTNGSRLMREGEGRGRG